MPAAVGGGQQLEAGAGLARMADTTFFWHDYETFGRVPRRDRPAQFAGVRTDAELNEIGEPVMLHCQPAPDFAARPRELPADRHPAAALPAAGRARTRLRRRHRSRAGAPGTVGVGYNSIRFDDEVTRLPVLAQPDRPLRARMAERLRPLGPAGRGALHLGAAARGHQWPRHDDGRPSFKLEHLTAANGLAHEAAHDALSDVRATIALARLVRAPAAAVGLLPEAARQGRGARRDGRGRPFLHLSGMYPVERGCMAWCGRWRRTRQQERGHRLGPGARPGRACGAGRRDRAPAHVQQAADLPEGVRGCPSRPSTSTSRRSSSATSRRWPAMAERWGIDLAAALRHAERRPRWAGARRPVGPVFARPAPARRPTSTKTCTAASSATTDRRTLQRLRELSPERSWPASAGLRRRAAGGTAVPLPRAQLPDTLSDEEHSAGSSTCARACTKGGRRAHAGAVLRAHRRAGRERRRRGQAILEALYDYAEDIAPEPLVMVVDDSKVVRVKTSRLLAAHHFRVSLAEDGQAALEVIAREAPQVLITDVEMPGMDGLSLTRAVRADARTATLPVVMITSADDRLKDEAAAAGVTVLMGKPYSGLRNTHPVQQTPPG
jgi:exodeoxyribonuclease-1